MNPPSHAKIPLSFTETLERFQLQIKRTPTEVLQLNLGKYCNQACHHCHVEAGPTRTEKMEQKTAERAMALLAEDPSIRSVDLTGGAPELNSNFTYLVKTSRQLGKEVIDRCNLTVLVEKGQVDRARFLKDHQVRIIASLPCYSKENVDQQRGRGVFEKSITALRILNKLGYGQKNSGLLLDLVYNPLGAQLPPPQEALEESYKKELGSLFGIQFNHLLTLSNMPIHRFSADLTRQGKLQMYQDLLRKAFNPKVALGLMCRNLISVGWDGEIYDCDFNQMLEMPLGKKRRTLWDIESFQDLQKEEIFFAEHCFGCTAGAGSSCKGALT